ncbi:MAG: VOC family protein [Flavobacteriales bacterium]|nr:VOC family protein [Flavobacteriales bacterium]
MQFRYARHTNNLEKLTAFYAHIIGLKILGQFQDHDDYDGVFFGHPYSDWHLEFTTSSDSAKHTPDDDDLLVFYFEDQKQIDTIIKTASLKGFGTIKPKNPYWKLNGVQLNDPDGYGIVLALRQRK